MSGYYWRSFNFEIRDDVAPAAMAVLDAVARDTTPAEDALRQIHPVARYYLSDWRRLIRDGEVGPAVGPPVRLTRSQSQTGRDAEDGSVAVVPKLSIEWTMHDDAYRDGGYIFELWILALVRKPTPASPYHPSRFTIGWQALYPNDPDAKFFYVDADGFARGDGATESFDTHDFWLHEVPAEEWEEQMQRLVDHERANPPEF